MVDSTDPGFYGAAWRFTNFCQQLCTRSVHLQFVLKSSELPGLFRSSQRFSRVCELVVDKFPPQSTRRTQREILGDVKSNGGTNAEAVRVFSARQFLRSCFPDYFFLL